MLNKIWTFLKKDPRRRLLALVFAISIYLHLNYEVAPFDRDFHGIKVPVTLSLESGLQPPQEQPLVEIDLKAQSGFDVDMDKLTPRIHVYATVKKRDQKKDDTYEVKIRPRDVKLPDPRLKTSRIVSPADGLLRLTLLRQDERDVPVQPVWKEAAPPGMELKWEAFPDQVRITGAKHVISRLQAIPTRPIPLTDSPESFEYDSDLNPPPGVTAAPRKVRFRIKLVRKVSRRSMLLPATVLVPPGNMLSAAIISGPENSVEVVLRGPAAELAKLTPKQVRLFVDATEVPAPGRRRLPVRCHVDVPEIAPISIVPAELEVQFTKNTSEINKPRKEK